MAGANRVLRVEHAGRKADSTGMSLEHSRPNPKLFATCVQDIASEQDRRDLINLLSADREYAGQVLGELADNQDPEIRHWAAQEAADVLGRDAVPILRRLVRDRDSNVRIDALRGLGQVDPGELVPMIPKLRAETESQDGFDAQAAIWALGALGDPANLDVVRAATRRDRARPRNTAIAVELLISDPEQLCQRIESHDHDLMPWLTYAAAMLGTERARLALEHCALNAPDGECRVYATKRLARFIQRAAE